MPSRTRVYDNAAEFASDIPTYAHHLRRAGYQTSLSGKMHFVGPDQLHGYEERLTTDIYPADFGWTPDYTRPGERIDWWYHNLGSVKGAGVAEITNQLEYDDEVAYQATRKLYDLARGHDARPWCLTVSFTHPHDPYVARREFWDLYADCAELDPAIPPVARDGQDAHGQRLMLASDHANYPISQEDVRRARRGYFANISYVDQKIGEILDVLKRTRQDENTIVVFLSDHGDMLGERGMWFKMSFFEGSARVPLMIAAPGPEFGLRPAASTRQSRRSMSCPRLPSSPASTSAKSFPGPTARASSASQPVHRSAGRSRWNMPPRVRSLRWWPCATAVSSWCFAKPTSRCSSISKATRTSWGTLRPIQLSPKCSHCMTAAARSRWDLQRFDADVRASQARRRVVYEALRNGAYYPWDHQPLQRASERYMRNHMDLNVLEETQRFPRGE